VPPLVPLAAGAVPAGVAFALTGAQTPSLAAGVAAGTVTAGGVLADRTAAGDRGLGAASTERRRVLGGVATGFAFAIGGYVFGGGGTTLTSDLDVSTDTAQEADSLLREASEKSLGVDGLEPLVSESFYTVDVASVDPTPDLDSWELTVTGDVEQEVSYSYEDLTAMDAENRFESLRCVGEGLNGKKLDTALWQGVPITDLVDPAGVPDNCCVMLRAADGFYEEFPLDALADGFLAFGMNGDVLPRGHGYPARALIPGHWGEINVKWITEIEILEMEQEGYWEKRGWHGTGPVNTVAKLHVTNDLDDGRKQVAGHAYAGTRGIQTVEVSTDGGDTWAEARLSDPLPGDDVWRQWAYEYDSPGESHEVVVRATDGTGTVQPSERQDAFPSGPTGWVSKTVDG
jgi:DMSO/TMAO reductase YedYZ molybdopterin-dependent catalytic subunit